MSHPPSEHEWVKPPAGTASSRDLICKRCGAKQSTAEGTHCDQEDREIVIATTHDYDPLA